MLRQEFLETEANYVQNLDTIVKVSSSHYLASSVRCANRLACCSIEQVFLNPLKKFASDEHNCIIPPQHIDLIFSRYASLCFSWMEVASDAV